MSASASSPLEFNPAEHRYRLRGFELPSVTSIIQDLGLYPKYPEDPLYRRRGAAVHAACKLLLEGRLDRKRSGPALAGYLQSLELWIATSGFRPKMSEQPVWSETWRFAGTLDIHGEMQDQNTLVDLKTGQPPKAARLQTAAYVLAAKESQALETTRRFTIQLFADGRPGKPEEHLDLARDVRNFLSAVSVWHLREEFGVVR